MMDEYEEEYEDEYEDELSAIEARRGCPSCSLYWEWLSGCPHYCAKWALRKDEADRNWRDKEIVKAYEDRRKK